MRSSSHLFPGGPSRYGPRMRFVIASALAVALSGCTTAQQGSVVPSAAMAPSDLHGWLSDRGPDRFARVTPTLYRGGEPSARDLDYLRALGVTKVVDLRREGLGARRAERAMARHLGLEYVEYPFFGLFGARPEFLDALLGELEAGDGGAVYVHCDDGEDRTSLAVALFRVVHQGWSPDTAWHREVLEFGHRPNAFNREIELTFRDHAYEHDVRRQTATQSDERRLAVERSLGERTGSLVQSSSSNSGTGSAAP